MTRLITAGVVLVTPESAVDSDFVFVGESRIEAKIAALQWAVRRLEFEIEELQEKEPGR